MATAGTRDPRFVTAGRGGSLTDLDHRLLAAWAAACAERVLPIFTAARPDDMRPGAAIVVARRWASGAGTVADARAAAVDAHSAARAASGGAEFAARAAGHAVASAHMADHALQAALYALRAVRAEHSDDDVTLDAERRWQQAALPASIAERVRDGLRLRATTFPGLFD